MNFFSGEDQQERLDIQVDAGEAHDRVVEPVLVGYQEPTDRVENEILHVIGREEWSEHFSTDGHGR